MESNNVEIIIPAYNEEESIAEVLKGIRSVLGNKCLITVVDDSSQDKTAEIARGLGADVVSHPYRMGNGACIKTGLRRARAEIVVLMDGDLQHAPEDIPLLLSCMDTLDMAVGARDFSKLSMRNFANRVYNAFASYITHFRIQDLTSGFRAIRRKIAVKFIYLLPNSFSYPTTLTLSFLKTGRAVKFLPIASPLRKAGRSKIHPVKDGIKFFLIITRIATFYSPMKVFLPVSFLFFATGSFYYLYTYFNTHRFTNMSALLFTASIIIFMLGLVSEQIAQLRMDRTED